MQFNQKHPCKFSAYPIPIRRMSIIRYIPAVSLLPSVAEGGRVRCVPANGLWGELYLGHWNREEARKSI